MGVRTSAVESNRYERVRKKYEGWMNTLISAMDVEACARYNIDNASLACACAKHVVVCASLAGVYANHVGISASLAGT